MASVLLFFDGSWFVDAASFAVAVAYAYWKSLRAPVKQKFVSKSTAMDVANGTSLFPLFALSLSLFLGVGGFFHS